MRISCDANIFASELSMHTGFSQRLLHSIDDRAFFRAAPGRLENARNHARHRAPSEALSSKRALNKCETPSAHRKKRGETSTKTRKADLAP
jgi:hypothetical protein